MSSVIGRPSCQVLDSTTRPYRKAPMTTAQTSYTTSRDVTPIRSCHLAADNLELVVPGECRFHTGSNAPDMPVLPAGDEVYG